MCGGAGFMGLALAGAWLDTLLGPEGSAVLLYGWGFWSSLCLGARVLRVWWVLVGLLFEICIVDASIFSSP